jgi:preprotein translocase subunit SecF
MLDTMKYKWWFFIFSILVIVPGMVSLALFGLRLSIDFSGGTLLEYQFSKPLTQDEVRQTVSSKQVEVSSVVPADNNTFIIKAKPMETEKINEVKTALTEKYGDVVEKRVENVGPVIGAETTKNALLALLIASVMIVLYIAWSFRKVPKPTSSWRFGIAAVVALLHDVLLVIGIFSILGQWWGVEVDVLFVTAILTIIGFSVHDTIVVFDRIRENLPRHLSKKFIDVANISITQTLARSLNTSLTVILVLLALLLFGGESIRWFVVALLVGIASGTYSSIFNATAVLAVWEEKLGH